MAASKVSADTDAVGEEHHVELRLLGKARGAEVIAEIEGSSRRYIRMAPSREVIAVVAHG
jgi:hypothetical protein